MPGMTIMRTAAAGMILAAMAVGVLAAGLAAAAEKKTEKSTTVEDVAKALAFDKDSPLARAMSDVDDNVPRWREDAFYLLLKQVADLGPLAEGQLARLDRPAYRSLLVEPKHYRCRAMRMTVRVHRVRKITGRDLRVSNTVWDKPVWRLSCSDAALSVEDGPIMICSAAEPTGLGEPSDKTPKDAKRFHEDELLYKGAPQVELACVFYKVYKDEREDTSEDRAYPVAVAWHVAAAEGRSTGLSTPDLRYVGGAVAVAGICIAYYFIRKRTKRLGKGGHKVQYRPKRDEIDAQVDADAPPGAEDEEDQSVDPLLAEAAEDYKRERQDRDAEDHG